MKMCAFVKQADQWVLYEYVIAHICVQYFEVVDQQLVEGGVSIKVDQKTLVFHNSDARWLKRDTQAFQLLLTLLKKVHIS